MADPYASRSAVGAALEAPGGEPGWLTELAERCEILLRPGDAATAEPGTRPLGVVAAEAATLAPIARLDPARAVLMLAVSGPGPASVAALEDALKALDGRGRAIYLLKHGFVAGPQGAPGCLSVEGDLLSRVLEADRRGEVGWERDPDYGYEVAASVPGLDSPEREALCPRLLYAAHDRVYEHAELVAETKRRWHERLGDPGAVPEEVLAAVGWPPEPTGTAWKGG